MSADETSGAMPPPKTEENSRASEMPAYRYREPNISA